MSTLFKATKLAPGRFIVIRTVNRDELLQELYTRRTRVRAELDSFAVHLVLRGKFRLLASIT